MSTKAVIDLQWHQYIVAPWDMLVVDQLSEQEGKKIDFNQVLLVFDDEWKKVLVGKPHVKGAVVSAKIVKHQKGDKVKVVKFQGKKRYHRNRGFRPTQTVLSIENIRV